MFYLTIWNKLYLKRILKVGVHKINFNRFKTLEREQHVKFLFRLMTWIEAHNLFIVNKYNSVPYCRIIDVCEFKVINKNEYNKLKQSLDLYCQQTGMSLYTRLSSDKFSQEIKWELIKYLDILNDMVYGKFKYIRFQTSNVFCLTKTMINDILDILNCGLLKYEFLYLPSDSNEIAEYCLVRKSNTCVILRSI